MQISKEGAGHRLLHGYVFCFMRKINVLPRNFTSLPFNRTHLSLLLSLTIGLLSLGSGAPQCVAAPQKTKGSDDKRKKDTPQAALNRFADAANFQNNSAFDLAIEEWTKLLKEFPDDPIAFKANHYLGVCHLRKDAPDYDAAIACFEKALKDGELDVREESLFDLGLSLYNSGRELEGDEKQRRLDRGFKAFQAFLQDYPDSAEADKAHFYAGECEYLLGKREQAVKSYSVLAKNPNFAKSAIRPDALYAMGVALEELQKDAQAKDTFEEFLKQYGDHKLASDVRLRQAEIALRANDFPTAVSILEQLVNSKRAAMPDYALYRYAFALAKAGDFKKSASMYQLLSKEYPTSPYAANAALATGQTLMRDKRYEEAKPFFEKLLPQQDESAAEAAHWIAQIAILTGKPADAVQVAKQALPWAKKSPFFTAIKMDLADALVDTAKGREEALPVYQDIANTATDNALAVRATYTAAFTSLQLGNPTDAKTWANRFLTKYPKEDLAADAGYVLAESQLQLGERPQAIEAFRKLVATHTSNPMLNLWKLRLATATFLQGDFQGTLDYLKKETPNLQQPEQQAEAQFLIGASYLRLTSPKEAIASFEKCLTTAPKWNQADEATLLLSQAQQQNNDSEAAKATLNRLLKNYPDSRFKVQAQYRLGQIAANAGDYPTAMARYDEILGKGERPPQLDFVAYAKAFVLMQLERYDESIALLKPLAVDSRNDGVGRESRLALAINYRKKGQIEDALALLKRMAEGSEKNDYQAKALYELGITCSQAKQWEPAIASLQRIRKDYPTFGNMDRVLFELGWCFKEQGQAEKSAETFRELTEKFPQSPLAAEAAYHVGQGLYEKKDFGQAVEAYTAAYSSSKDRSVQEKALHKMGWALFKQEQFDKAEGRFQEQLKSFPDGELRVDGSFMLAQCLFKKQDYPKALEGYTKARASLESHPDPASISESICSLIYLHGAQCLRELKKFDQAESWLKVFTAKYTSSPFLPEALYETAYCYQNLKRGDDALKLYEEVASKYRNEISARARFMMGEVHFANREFPKAISEFQRVMYGYGGNQAPAEIKNWQARSAFEAGRCAETLITGQKGERLSKAVGIAREFYKFVVDNHPKSDLAPQAEIRLAALEKIES